MNQKLTEQIAKVAKHRKIKATVLEILGDRCTVSYPGGRIFRVKIVGGIPSVGEEVYLDWNGYEVTVMKQAVSTSATSSQSVSSPRNSNIPQTDPFTLQGWKIDPTTDVLSHDSGNYRIDPVKPSLELGDAVDFMSGTGIWMGKHTGSPPTSPITAYKMHVGNPNGSHWYWDGSELHVEGILEGNIVGTDNNTFTIDQDNSSSTSTLYFGNTSTTQGEISWNGSYLSTSKDLYSTGRIYVGGLPGTDAMIFGKWINTTATGAWATGKLYAYNRSNNGGSNADGLWILATADTAVTFGWTWGIYSHTAGQSTGGTSGNLYGFETRVSLSSTHNASLMTGWYNTIVISGSGSLPTATGMELLFYKDPAATTTPTNAYGIKINDVAVGTNNYAILTNLGKIVFNDGAGDADVQIKGDNDQNLIYSDASADAVGIGVAAPAAKLNILKGGSNQFRISYDAAHYAELYTSSGGNLSLIPQGDIYLDPQTAYVYPGDPYYVNLGSLSNKYLTLHAAELWVETLVAQNTIATIGGRILVGPTTTLAKDLSPISEILLNGGFETAGGGGGDTLANWDEYPATGGSITQNGTIKRSGSYSARIISGSSGATSYAKQVISGLTPGTRLYLYGYSYATTENCPGAYAVYDQRNSAWIISRTDCDGKSAAWYPFSAYFTLPTNCDIIEVYLYSDNAASLETNYFDDVGVRAGCEITVKHNQMASGDITYMEANAVVEFFQIMSSARTAGSYYAYDVTRDYEASGSTHQWYAGDAMFNTGTTGEGFIDIYSVSSMKPGAGQSGPTIVGNVRTGTTYNAWTENWAIGNLGGLYGKSSGTYGVGLGKYSIDEYMVITSTGIEMFDDADARYFLLGDPGGGFGLYMGNMSYEHIKLSSTALTFYDNTTVMGSLSGTTWTLGQAGQERVVITTSSISLQDDSNRQRVSIDSNGVRLRSAADVITIQIDSSGDAIFGSTGSGKANLFWDESTGRLNFRVATGTPTVYVDATNGYVYAGNGKARLSDAGVQVISADIWDDGSAYQIIYGATNVGYLGGYQSSSVNYVGLRAGAVASRATQLWVQAFTAGSQTGSIELRADGNNGSQWTRLFLYSHGTSSYNYAQIVPGGFVVGAPTQSTSYPYWTTAGVAAIELDLYVGSGLAVGYLGAGAPGSTEIWLGGSDAKLLRGTKIGTYDSLRIQTTGGWADIGPQNSSFCHLNTDRNGFYFYQYVDTAEGFYAGSSADPGVGNIRYTGALASYKNSTTYTGYIFVPLTTPLSDTAWDGDARSDVGTSTELDLYDIFGVPINAKAVVMGITTRDSATLGTTGLYFACGPTSTYWYAGVCRPPGGDVQVENSCVVPVSMDASNHPTVWYQISASGTSTLDVWIYIWGYWI